MIDEINEMKRHKTSNTSNNGNSLNEEFTRNSDADTATTIRIKVGEVIGISVEVTAATTIDDDGSNNKRKKNKIKNKSSRNSKMIEKINKNKRCKTSYSNNVGASLNKEFAKTQMHVLLLSLESKIEKPFKSTKLQCQ